MTTARPNLLLAQGPQAAQPPMMPGGLAAGQTLPPGAGGPPHDIQELIPYATPWQTYALWAVVAFVVLALLIAAYLIWRRKHGKGETFDVPVDPWDVLTERLRGLSCEGVFERKAQEEYFFQLSMVLREAIELRTRLPATDLTFQELREPLRRKLPLPMPDIDAVLTFLERADQVKFAEAEAKRVEAEQSAAKVLTWLTALKPRPVVETEGAKGVRGLEGESLKAPSDGALAVMREGEGGH